MPVDEIRKEAHGRGGGDQGHQATVGAEHGDVDQCHDDAGCGADDVVQVVALKTVDDGAKDAEREARRHLRRDDEQDGPAGGGARGVQVEERFELKADGGRQQPRQERARGEDHEQRGQDVVDGLGIALGAVVRDELDERAAVAEIENREVGGDRGRDHPEAVPVLAQLRNVEGEDDAGRGPPRLRWLGIECRHCARWRAARCRIRPTASGRGRAGSLGPLAGQDDLHRVENDRDVEAEREVLDVVKVVAQLLHGILDGSAVPIPHLRPPRKSGSDRVALGVEGNLRAQLLDEERALGPRTDEAHVPSQHVPELRQLVEPRLADHPADGGDTIVAVLRPHGRPRLGIGAHRAELIEREGAAVEAHAVLAIENGSPGFEPDRDARDHHERRGEEGPKQRQPHVGGALCGARQPRHVKTI